jgi:ribosome biogenesis GTPase A
MGGLRCNRLSDVHDLLLTPFERNLEVWRQLWRVLERSHLIVQIVDARNPENFRSSDLEDYVRSLDAEGKIVDKGSEEGSKRKALLLINKSDLLTLDQRSVPVLCTFHGDRD